LKQPNDKEKYNGDMKIELKGVDVIHAPALNIFFGYTTWFEQQRDNRSDKTIVKIEKVFKIN